MWIYVLQRAGARAWTRVKRAAAASPSALPAAATRSARADTATAHVVVGWAFGWPKWQALPAHPVPTRATVGVRVKQRLAPGLRRLGLGLAAQSRVWATGADRARGQAPAERGEEAWEFTPDEAGRGTLYRGGAHYLRLDIDRL